MLKDKYWTTKIVAEAFGVKPGTLRGWIHRKLLPEPGWGKKGTRRERHYTRKWIVEASNTLEIPTNWEILEQ